MAQSDTAATPQPALCGASSPKAIDPAGFQTTCVRRCGHDGDHSNGEVIWRDPDTGAPFIAGATIGSILGTAFAGMGGRSSGGSTHEQDWIAAGGGTLAERAARAADSSPADLGDLARAELERLQAPWRCGSVKMFDGVPVTCKRSPGHYGAHDNDAGLSWSAAPPLGPVPERFKRIGSDGKVEHVPEADVPAFVAQLERERARMRFNVVPGTEGLPGAGYLSQRRPLAGDMRDTLEVLLAGLVACGRSLGQIDKEIGARAHWKRVLGAALQVQGVTADSELTDEQWARIGKYIWASVQLVVSERSEPAEPIQMRAEALAILIMKGQRVGVPPNVLIRAGAVLEVLRAVWRKAQRGGT